MSPRNASSRSRWRTTQASPYVSTPTPICAANRPPSLPEEVEARRHDHRSGYHVPHLEPGIPDGVEHLSQEWGDRADRRIGGEEPQRRDRGAPLGAKDHEDEILSHQCEAEA